MKRLGRTCMTYILFVQGEGWGEEWGVNFNFNFMTQSVAKSITSYNTSYNRSFHKSSVRGKEGDLGLWLEMREGKGREG